MPTKTDTDRLATQLVRATAKLADAHAQRDALVVQMREAGATLEAIANAAGMTPAGVHKLIARMGR